MKDIIPTTDKVLLFLKIQTIVSNAVSNVSFGIDIDIEDYNRIRDEIVAEVTRTIHASLPSETAKPLTMICPKCEGKGYTAEHNPGCEGDCEGQCPIQVQCEYCHCVGTVAIESETAKDQTLDGHTIFEWAQMFSTADRLNKAKDQRIRELDNIKIHMGMLCTDEIRAHACASATEHDLNFQIFRILGGYDEALKTIAAMQRQIDQLKSDLEHAEITRETQLSAQETDFIQERNTLKRQIDDWREVSNKMSTFIRTWSDCLSGVQMANEDFNSDCGLKEYYTALKEYPKA